MSSADDLVHRLAAKMASADHDAPPAVPDRGQPGGAAEPVVLDLTDAATGGAEDGDGVDDGEDAVIHVIVLDTYEAAHQLAVEVDQRG